MSIINTYNIFINSDNRTSGTSSDFKISLFKPIVLTNPNNFFTVRVGSCEIPYTFKLINNVNNIIQYTFQRSPALPLIGTFVITPGNYNIIDLLAEIKTKLTASIFALASFTPPFIFTYDRSSGHCTFSILGIDSIFTSVQISNTTLNAGVLFRCLGFVGASFSFSYTSPSFRADATSTQNVNVSQNTALYLRSETFTQTTNSENIVDKSGISDILAKIQVNTPPMTYLFWTNPSDLEVSISNRIIDIIGLYLGTSTSYSLDLGNLDWSTRLTIHERSYEDIKDQHSYLAKNMNGQIPNPLLEKRTALLEQLKTLRGDLLSPEK